MVISGGDYLEWPIELESEKEIDMEQAFDEAMWAWALEQGPPQDDDIVWLKKAIVQATGQAAGIIINTPYVDEEQANAVGAATAKTMWEQVNAL